MIAQKTPQGGVKVDWIALAAFFVTLVVNAVFITWSYRGLDASVAHIGEKVDTLIAADLPTRVRVLEYQVNSRGGPSSR